MAVDNLKLQQQINEAMRERQKLLEKQTKELESQSDMAERIRESISKINFPDDSTKQTRDFNKSVQEGTEKIEEQKDLHEELEEKIRESFETSTISDWVESLEQANRETSTLAVGWGAFASGMFETGGFIGKTLKTIIGLAGELAGTVFSIGKAILAIPIKIFNGLVDIANSFHGGTQLMQAFEDIRKQFGDFRTGVSKDVIGASRQLRGSLEGTGLRSYRVFGLLYERLNLVRELMTDMGAVAHQFSGEIYRNAEAVLQFQKGLGMTNEAMGAMAIFANKHFTTLADSQRMVANQSLQMGKRFGIDQKVIARDISEMVLDFKTFGSVGTKQMASLSVFARKLGADFKELLGIVDKFDNFEDAAESAAKLAQSFGLNIDAFEMMKAQDPGERIDMLRKSFFDAGKSIEGMTRQERNLLAQTTGLEGASLEATFAAKNQALSYQEVQNASADAEKSQLSQAEALKGLTNSIERLVKQGNRQGGFFQRFMMGFRKGLFWTRDFWKMIRNIKRSLWAAERAGRRVGRAFAKLFPGVATALEGLKEFFATMKGSRDFMNIGPFQEFVNDFRQLFSDLGDPKLASNALGRFFENLRKSFKMLIGKETTPAGKIVSGFKRIFKAIGSIALQGLRLIMDQFTFWIKKITKVVLDPAPFTDAFMKIFGEAKDGSKTMVGKLIDAIKEALGKSWGALVDATQTLFGILWNKVKKFAIKKWNEITDNQGIWGLIKKGMKFLAFDEVGQIISLILFGPSIIKAVIASGIHMMSKVALGIGSHVLKSKTGSKIGEVVGENMNDGILKKITNSSMAKKITDSFSGIAKKTGGKFLMAGKSIGSLLFRGLTAILGTLGATIASAIGVGLAAYFGTSWLLEATGLDKQIDKLVGWITGQTENLRKNVNDAISKMQAGMPDFISKQASIVKNQELSNALRSKEKDALSGIQSVLNTNIDLSLKDRKIALQAVRFKQDQLKAELSRQIVEREGIKLGRGGKASAEDRIKIEERINEELRKRGTVLMDVNSELKNIAREEEKKKNLESLGKKPVAKGKEFGSEGSGLSDKAKRVADISNSMKTIEGAKFNKEKVVKRIGDVEATINSIAQQVSVFAGDASALEAPVVKGITNMVTIANEVSEQLSNLKALNASVKLRELGKALGMGATEEFTIKQGQIHQHFHINVSMDAKKVADATLETGRVAAGPRMQK